MLLLLLPPPPGLLRAVLLLLGVFAGENPARRGSDDEGEVEAEAGAEADEAKKEGAPILPDIRPVLLVKSCLRTHSRQ